MWNNKGKFDSEDIKQMVQIMFKSLRKTDMVLGLK